MIRRVLLLMMLALIVAVQESRAAQTVVANMEATNPVGIQRSELLVVSLADLGIDPKSGQVSTLHILDDNSVLPSEIVDANGDSKIDSIVFQANLAANQTRRFSIVSDADLKSPVIKKQTQAEISIKEGGQWNGNHYDGGRFVNVQHVKPPPQHNGSSTFIRYEGPGIESDKVAYRIYLDQRNGFDIFGKKIPDMVLQNIGHDNGESYENDAPWGLDIFKVGNSLGTGGFGYWNGKQVESIASTASREATIMANGNLYAAFDICYNKWQVNENAYDMSALISMNAGSRLAHNQVHIKPLGETKDMPAMAIGVVHHPNTKLIESDSHSNLEWAYMASWGKQSRITPGEYLGVGVIFHRSQRIKQTEDNNSYVSVMDASKGVLDYYFFAAWDKEPGGIKTEAELKAFLDQQIELLSVPLKVTLFKPHQKHIH